MGPTRTALEDLGKTALPLALPAVYRGPEGVEVPPLPPRLARHQADLDPCTFKLFCAARWLWDSEGALSIDERNVKTKNSDMLLRGLAEFRKRIPGAKIRLFTFEYGSSVDASKRLADDLGLSDVLVWLPTMERRELTLLMSRCDVVVGEFYIDPGVIWGSTGWESLAAGKPLIQSFNFGSAEFSDTFGYPPPPILDAKSPAAVADQLTAMFADPGRRVQIGTDSAKWFNQYNGINLARRWLDVLTS
jgi:glycosyltransferase involved in cell wall biosynthesis